MLLGVFKMNEQHKAVTVRILDKDYIVACPVGQSEALLNSAQIVDKKMREIRQSGKVLGIERIAVMVALNLSNELLNIDKNSHSIDVKREHELLNRLSNLQRRIDLTIKDCKTN